MGLQKYIEKKLKELESNQEYFVSTDSIKTWINEYHVDIDKMTKVDPDYYYDPLLDD